MKKYFKFVLMVLVSTVVMFGLMYFNIFSVDHLFFSQTRVFMALMMGAVMAILMLLFMWKMYSNKKANYAILALAFLTFGVSLYLVRSQATVKDVSWMEAMVPHHSIAILTSERAELEDPRVKKLSEDIIEAQKREIEEMEQLIKELKEKDK